MAEYDALPGIGHGCGHNLIATSSLGAAAALARAGLKLDGDFVLIGTPAEEGGGGKARLADAGVFDGVDMALLCHPGRHNRVGDPSLGRIKVKIAFHGKTAHAATAPHLGRNALDALVLAYVNISAMRQQLPADVRVHGVITKGGEAPNIIPDYAEGLYYVRSLSKTYLFDTLIHRFEACLKGAAEASGCTYEMAIQPPSLEPMLRNHALERAWGDNAEALGVEIRYGDEPPGSSDVGNISHLMPTIQPRLAICDPSVNIHSTDFADATQSETGKGALLLAAKTLAMTVYDYLTQPELRRVAAEEFANAAR
jgi:amidohydrolase